MESRLASTALCFPKPPACVTDGFVLLLGIGTVLVWRICLLISFVFPWFCYHSRSRLFSNPLQCVLLFPFVSLWCKTIIFSPTRVSIFPSLSRSSFRLRNRTAIMPTKMCSDTDRSVRPPTHSSIEITHHLTQTLGRENNESKQPTDFCSEHLHTHTRTHVSPS